MNPILAFVIIAVVLGLVHSIIMNTEYFGLVVNPITICNNNCEKCKANASDKEACDACASCKK